MVMVCRATQQQREKREVGHGIEGGILLGQSKEQYALEKG
jgi:hypothetical protein